MKRLALRRATVTNGLRATNPRPWGFHAAPLTAQASTRMAHDGQGESSRDHQATKQGQTHPPKAESQSKGKGKTMAELDEELKAKLEGLAGEGGAAGVEYENGKAEGLRRGVKSNMFRV
ncbi:hypothetical protein SODALDRAFT_326097, partial [Sodiomyces alkalinus F11]